MVVPQAPAIPWKRLLFSGLAFLALSLLGLYVLYRQFNGQSLAFDTRLLQPWVLASLLALLLLYYLFDSLRLLYVLKALGHKLPFRFMLRLVFINLFFSNITPMATGGGFFQIWYLQAKGVPLGHATAATSMRTLLAVAFIFSLTPLCLMTLPVFDGSLIPHKIELALGIFGFVYLGFFALILLRPRWLVRPLTRIVHLGHRLHLINERRERRWLFKLRKELLRFTHSFRDVWRGDRRYALAALGFTFLFLLSLFSFPALLIWGLGYSVDYLLSLALMLVTTFIMYFSPTPGASGISEGVFGRFFSEILSEQHLLLVTFSWRLLTVYLGMLLGWLLLHRLFVKAHPNPVSARL